MSVAWDWREGVRGIASEALWDDLENKVGRQHIYVDVFISSVERICIEACQRWFSDEKPKQLAPAKVILTENKYVRDGYVQRNMTGKSLLPSKLLSCIPRDGSKYAPAATTYEMQKLPQIMFVGCPLPV